MTGLEPNATEQSCQEMVGELPKEGGGSVKVRYEMQSFKQIYLDEYTREEIPHALVRQAIV